MDEVDIAIGLSGIVVGVGLLGWIIVTCRREDRRRIECLKATMTMGRQLVGCDHDVACADCYGCEDHACPGRCRCSPGPAIDWRERMDAKAELRGMVSRPTIGL